MIGDLLNEALRETVDTVGVPEAAARAMLFGHIQVALANGLRGDNPFSDACLIAMDYGRNKIIKDGWKSIFDDDELDYVLKQIAAPGRDTPLILLDGAEPAGSGSARYLNRRRTIASRPERSCAESRRSRPENQPQAEPCSWLASPATDAGTASWICPSQRRLSTQPLPSQ